MGKVPIPTPGGRRIELRRQPVSGQPRREGGRVRRISGRFANGCGAGSHHAIPGSLGLPAVGKQAGRAFRFRMSPLPMHRVRWRERSLTALQAPNDVRLHETQMIKCAINLHQMQQSCRRALQASVFQAKRPPDRSDGRLQNPPLGGNHDQLAATCPPARRSAAARRSTSASAAVRASATHFSSTMSRP